jgi:HPt (histidine-containing phosphotransfer) domain-containing protein
VSAEPDEAKEALDMLRSFGGDELVRSLMATFLKFADEQMASAAQAAAAGDGAGIARAAHAIKSSSRQLGAFPLGEACERAETAGVDNADVAGAVAGFEAMKSELAVARRWMDAVIAGGV